MGYKDLKPDSVDVEVYKLRPSRILIGIEIGLHLLVLLSILVQLHGWILLLTLVLYLLIGWRYLQHQSSLAQFPAGCTLELNTTSGVACWKSGSKSFDYEKEMYRVLMSRWFIVLMLGRGSSRQDKLLLSDSFEDLNRYTRLRRQIKEIHQC